ncbi:MAG: hypothetical protein JSV04_12930, partial [Candidatus Heimdallarchaeota archaeon]
LGKYINFPILYSYKIAFFVEKKSMKLLNSSFFLVFLVLLLFFPLNTCFAFSIETPSSTYQEPVYWTTNGWRTSIPEEQGVMIPLQVELIPITIT